MPALTLPLTAGVASSAAGPTMAVARAVPAGALYSILLVLHVAAAVVGFGALLVTGHQASRAARGPTEPGAEAVRRYFRPGVNWPGRALYLVPVLGFALLGDSGGAFDASDPFVVAGLVLWLAAAAAAEVAVWPAERRVQGVVAARWDDQAAARQLARDCDRLRSWSWVLAGIFVAAMVVMVAKP